jgi:uncharacterized protein (UPF0276 family)
MGSIDPTSDRLAALPKLGVGLSFQGTLQGFVQENLAAFDFLEVIPDIFWTDQGRTAADRAARYRENQSSVAFLSRIADEKPVIVHSVGLSIGSADAFDTVHVEQIAAWHERFGFPWHSDHLSFNRLEQASGHAIDIGVTLPVPYDEPVLDLLCERVAHVQATVPVPFLLENNVYYFAIPEQEMGEAEFLNRLSARTGCGLLLDLHNVYTNARNHGFDPHELLDGLDLSRVVEIHLGGGMEVDGTYLDAHSGPCPPEVWGLLEEILPRTPNLAGVVFEMFGNYFPSVGPEPLKQELRKAREILDRRA